MERSKSDDLLNVFFDTDVIINWLTKEVDPNTGQKLWEAPYKIIRSVDQKKIIGYSSLFNIMEIRFVLRRKKDYDDSKINEMTDDFEERFTIQIPDNMDLLGAENLQREYPLDPFDSVYFSLSQENEIDVILTRDKEFQEIIDESGAEIKAMEPETFLEKVDQLSPIE
ncbi:MAG: type II toxin-antitoxin system VapC family toxin [Candidatus Thermoplasmatota archaeon]